MTAAAAAGSGGRGQFDRTKLSTMCTTEAQDLRSYAGFLDNFKEQVSDTVNSEQRLQEIYQETAPSATADSGAQGGKTVKAYLVGNDLKTVGTRRRQELEAAAVKVQRAYRAHRIRKRWLQLVSRMVKVGGASDADTRLVPATLFDSYDRSRCLTGAKGAAASAAVLANSRSTVPTEERLATYRRSRELLHGDEFTRW